MVLSVYFQLKYYIFHYYILVLIAFPSFKLLYLMDEVTDPSLSVLAEGHHTEVMNTQIS
jgi:hypothetical protein